MSTRHSNNSSEHSSNNPNVIVLPPPQSYQINLDEIVESRVQRPPSIQQRRSLMPSNRQSFLPVIDQQSPQKYQNTSNNSFAFHPIQGQYRQSYTIPLVIEQFQKVERPAARHSVRQLKTVNNGRLSNSYNPDINHLNDSQMGKSQDQMNRSVDYAYNNVNSSYVNIDLNRPNVNNSFVNINLNQQHQSLSNKHGDSQYQKIYSKRNLQRVSYPNARSTFEGQVPRNENKQQKDQSIQISRNHKSQNMSAHNLDQGWSADGSIFRVYRLSSTGNNSSKVTRKVINPHLKRR